MPEPSSAEADRVEAAVRDRLAPSPAFLARVAQVRESIVARATDAARARSSPLVRALVAGSAARGTFLADRLDIDLFLLFPPELPRDRLRAEGMAIGGAILTATETKFAEHPYLRGTFDGFRVDAVPGYAVADAARPLSAVDRTPFHQAWLEQHETPEMVAEVRLAKQFLRALGVYGSEVRTEGLSGYTVELLIVRFGSFRALLRAAQLWRVPVRIGEPAHDPPRLPEDVAMILADPVDPHRNVSSALSRRNLGTLIVAARQYLDAPSEAWFEVRAPVALRLDDARERVRRRGSHVVVLALPRPEIVDDTLYPQLRKAERAVADDVARGGFELLGSASAADPTQLVVAVEVAHAHRAGIRRRDGPPAGIDRVGEFLSKWTDPAAPVVQGPFVRADGSVAVETVEAERDVERFVRERLPHLSLGRDVPTAPATVASLAHATESAALGEALRELLAKRLPWLEPRAATPRD